MEDIIYDVVIGFIVLFIVIVIIKVASGSSGSLSKGAYVRNEQENMQYATFNYDEYRKYSNEGRKFAGSEVISFLRYHEKNNVISEIDIDKYYPGVLPVGKWKYKYDGTLDKLDSIVAYIIANKDSENVGLLESQYTISYNNSTSKITFTLINK